MQVLTALALVEQGVKLPAKEAGLDQALSDVADALRVAQPDVVRVRSVSTDLCCRRDCVEADCERYASGCPVTLSGVRMESLCERGWGQN